MNENSTKNKIFETMYYLTAKKGYDKASIGQIAETIGIKKASVYYYFKSKEDIFLQMVKGLYKDDYYKKFKLFNESIGVDVYQNELLLVGYEFIDSYFENPDLRKVYAEIDIQTTRIPALKEFSSTMDKKFNEFLVQSMICGITIGIFPKDFDTKLNAQILYTTLIGIDQAILYDLSIDAKGVWKEVILKLFDRKALFKL